MPSNVVSFQNPSFTSVDLGTFGGHYSFAFAINNNGQMVGQDTKNETSNKSLFAPTYATVWDNSFWVAKTTLLSDQESHAYGINNLSTVVGYSQEDINGHQQILATAWQDGKTRYLPSVSNAQDESIARAVNDHGVIVGESFSSTSFDGAHATLWNDTGVIDLGTLGGKFSEAFAINNAGLVAGCSSTDKPDNNVHPVIWKEGKIIDLSPDHFGIANTVNDNGLVAGFIDDDQHISHATLWINQKEITLQASAGSSSYASAINNQNQIVGTETSNDGHQHALLWNTANSAPVDLNQYLDQSQLDAGWQLISASGINDQGWIIGSASNSKTYETHAFVLSADGVTELPGAAPVQAAHVLAATAPAAHAASADIWSGIY
ncbi:DUF3466 family protein [Undibacterium sp. Di27W]|uniref:DUF3466 family protein n=1 Tax=Undibacterium sp. Di27W TaxID=3413036 RepID=UPI003BF24B6F